MNLLPFDLEKALAGHPVVTRDGREVTQLHKFEAEHQSQTLYGTMGGCIWSWSDDGAYMKKEEQSPQDLFLKGEEPKKYWVNVYDHGNGYSLGSVLLSEEDAHHNAFIRGYIKTICIEL